MKNADSDLNSSTFTTFIPRPYFSRLLHLSLVLFVAGSLIVTLIGCSTNGSSSDKKLTIYSGRTTELVEPIILRFEEQYGVDVDVRYGSTGGLAAALLEEGRNSPADIFFSQSAGALGALSNEGSFALVPDDLLALVDPRFKPDSNDWIGISGRARVVVFNTDVLSETDLPNSYMDYTKVEWRGRVGWAPTNASFQAFLTALRLSKGESVAKEWISLMLDNDVKTYKNNSAIVQAVSVGDVEVGFANHYYLHRFLAEDPDLAARNHYPASGDPLGLVNAAGVGLLARDEVNPSAIDFIRFLLSEETQRYFADEVFEYPLAKGIGTNSELPDLDDLQPPDLDLSDITDVQGTIDLLVEAGVF
ncbi:MAG: iron ABC transporter substrate-binding protein [Chloroflexi bacterium]|nr:iron ABC transporter substrate-binding protein [Chloroflexota bacterium]